MKLETQFIVGAPLERVWPALKDAGVFASCVPGGELRLADDLYAGRLELATNGSRISCEATLRAVDDDEDEHIATILLRGRQLGGPGLGSLMVQSRCEAADSSTRVLLSAELLSSGHEPRGAAFETAARELFEEAGSLLEQRATAAPAPSDRAPERAAPAATERELLPVRRSVRGRLALTGGVLVGGALIGALVARGVLGRRRARLW